MLDELTIPERRLGVLMSFAVFQFSYLVECGEFDQYYVVNMHTGECGFKESSFVCDEDNTFAIKISGNPHDLSTNDILNAIEKGFYKKIKQASN